MKMFLFGLLLVPTLVSADTRLPVQTSSKAGITPTRIAAGISSTETYKARNDGRTFLLFEKTGAGNATVAIGVQRLVGGLAVSSQTLTVAATTGDKVVGPFPPSIFNDSNGDMRFTVSDTVGLSVGLIKL